MVFIPLFGGVFTLIITSLCLALKGIIHREGSDNLQWSLNILHRSHNNTKGHKTT